MLESNHHVCLPSVVIGVEGCTSEVVVACTAIEKDLRVFCYHEVCKDIEACLSPLYDVAVGGVQKVVLIEGVLLYAIVADTMLESDACHELGTVEVIHHSYVVCLLNVKVGITIGDACGGRPVNVWVEVADAWACYAHVVGESDVHGRSKLKTYVGCRYEIAVVVLEILTFAFSEFHVLPCMFISQSCLGTPFPPSAVIFGISCKYAVFLGVVHAQGIVDDILTVHYVEVV